MECISQRFCVRCSAATSRLGSGRSRVCRHAASYRIDVGKDVFYALDEDERQGVMDRIKAEKRTAKVSVTRFKGLGDEPASIARDRDGSRYPPLDSTGGRDQDDTVQGMDLLLSKTGVGSQSGWSRQGT